MSHGYPLTFWVQAGLCYAAGVYTAQEQGIMKRGAVFGKFWKHHYFDWISFMRRSGIYGIGGGLLLGTALFGNPTIALRRCHSKYLYYMKDRKADERDSIATWHVKFNN